MKSRLLFITSFLFLCSTVTVKAQDNTIKFEDIVNEQFGTLLESLLVNGKIDENNAKSYLETVFGYDESVSSYLQTADFTQHLNSVKQGNLSFDNYVKQINSFLLTFVPESHKADLMNNIQNQMLINNIIGEVKNGQIGIQTVNLIHDIIESNREWKVEKIKNAEIAKKIEAITPTLNKLNSSNQEYKKLHLVDEVESDKNWTAFHNPPDLVITRDINKIQRKTTNNVKLENGYLLLSDNYGTLNTPDYIVFEELRCYKNSEKFDFSKDFSFDLHFKVSDALNSVFVINIGKGCKIYVTRNVGSKGNIRIGVQDEYIVSEKFGVLNSSTTLDKTKKKQSRNYGYIADYIIGNSLWFYDKTKFDEVLKINITKTGNSFIVKFNDYPVDIKTEINYFPDKYYLGFKVENKSAKSFAQIHKVELEHL